MKFDHSDDDDDDIFPDLFAGMSDESVTDRITMFFVAIALGAISICIWRLAQVCLPGNGWGEWIARLLIQNVAIGVGLFSVLLLIRGLFAPAWIGKLLTFATKKMFFALSLVASLVLLLVIISGFASLIVFILQYFGVMA